jgi:DNA-binding beta-propeller fold protein YncE
VWVTGIGVTYEINAASGRIVRTISTPGTSADGCGSGIAAGAGAVWVTHSCRGVYRINPHSGRVTASFRVSEVGDAVAVADGLVWVPSDNGWLLRIQPRTDRIVGKRIPVGSAGSGDWVLTPSAGALWVTSYGGGGGTVSRVDPATGAVTPLPDPAVTDIEAVGAGSLWTSQVQRIDPATGKVIASDFVPGPALVTFWKGSAWALIMQRPLELLRISPATDEVSGEPVLVGKPLPTGYGGYPVAVSAGPTGLWVLDYTGNLLFHLVMRQPGPNS